MSVKQLRAEAKAWRRIGECVAKQVPGAIYAIPHAMLTTAMVDRINTHLVIGGILLRELSDAETQNYYVMRSELLALECEEEANALRPERGEDER